MGNAILILVIAAIVSAATWYIIRAKKNDQCIGCPHSKQCHGKCGQNK